MAYFGLQTVVRDWNSLHVKSLSFNSKESFDMSTLSYWGLSLGPSLAESCESTKTLCEVMIVI